MFRGSDGRKSLIKILGIVLACMAALIITRTILVGNPDEKPQVGETIVTVLDQNSVAIPEIDQNNCDSYSFEVNNGTPFFTEEEIANAEETGYFIQLSDFDALKRAQSAMMCANESHIRTEERDSDLSKLEPSGWHRNSIYERCHLLMWKLSGPDEIKNLITGTEYFNQVEMLQYEKQVTEYLWKHPENRVLYRVTPYYEGEELVARGVLMEALSIGDNGAFHMCEFVYNAQPGSEIEYATGTYHMYESWESALGITETEAADQDAGK